MSIAHQIARLSPLYWKQVDRIGEPKIVKVWRHDADDHDTFMTLVRGVLGWRPAEPDPDDAEEKKDGPATSRVAVGIRVFRPRQTILQRRILVEFAHELPLEAHERVLRAWCERTLGEAGCTWHAVIHRPEGRNDPRNWHAHIVYTTAAVGREVNADGRETGGSISRRRTRCRRWSKWVWCSTATDRRNGRGTGPRAQVVGRRRRRAKR